MWGQGEIPKTCEIMAQNGAIGNLAGALQSWRSEKLTGGFVDVVAAL